MCPPVRAHWRQVANTIELVLPWLTRVHKPNGKLIGSAIIAQLTASVVGHAGHVLSPNNCLFAWKIWAQSNTCLLWPTRVHSPNGISIGSAVLHISRQSVVILHNGHIGATWQIRLNSCFLRPTRVLNANSISIDDRFSRILHGSLV